MAADTEDQPKGFQVKDRRRFTESGEVREEAAGDERAEETPQAVPPPVPPPATDAAREPLGQAE